MTTKFKCVKSPTLQQIPEASKMKSQKRRRDAGATMKEKITADSSLLRRAFCGVPAGPGLLGTTTKFRCGKSGAPGSATAGITARTTTKKRPRV
jgi:hypothetical protein